MTQKIRREPITDERLQELRAMPYSDYLKTPEWYRKRAVLLKFADNRCQLCYTDHGPFNCHHRTYIRLGQERLSDLVLLCKGCHQLFHDNRKLHKEPRIQAVKAEAPSGMVAPALPLKRTNVVRENRYSLAMFPPLPDVTWAPGETAIHPMFGECLILAVDAPEYVIAQFALLPDRPQKMLALRFAKLQKAVAS